MFFHRVGAIESKAMALSRERFSGCLLGLALGDALGAERISEGRFAEAQELFMDMATFEEFEEFLTVPAYERLEAIRHAQAAE